MRSAAGQHMQNQMDIEKVFAGGGEMGKLMRATDWSKTALGPVSDWPQSLRTTVSTDVLPKNWTGLN